MLSNEVLEEGNIRADSFTAPHGESTVLLRGGVGGRKGWFDASWSSSSVPGPGAICTMAASTDCRDWYRHRGSCFVG